MESAGCHPDSYIDAAYDAFGNEGIGGPSSEAKPPDRLTFPSLTSAELDAADYDLRYAIDGILVEGQPCIVAGGKKTLKTNTLIDLSIALATGGRFLQRWKASRTYRVGLMSGESGPHTIQETARRVATAKGVKLADVDDLHWCFELPHLGDAADELRLRRWIEANRIEVLSIDPAYLCLPIGDDAANLFKVGQFLSTLSTLGEQTGCTVILCHHTRKRGKGQDSYDPPELDDIAWSGFPEWARQWLLIGRRTAYDPAAEGSHKLWLTAGGSAGHSGLYGVDIEEGSQRDAGGRRWDVSIVNAREARTEANGQREQQKALKHDATIQKNAERMHSELKNHPDGQTESKWASYVGLNKSAYTPAIARLRNEDRIEPCKVTAGNGQSYDGWKVAQSA